MGSTGACGAAPNEDGAARQGDRTVPAVCSTSAAVPCPALPSAAPRATARSMGPPTGPKSRQTRPGGGTADDSALAAIIRYIAAATLFNRAESGFLASGPCVIQTGTAPRSSSCPICPLAVTNSPAALLRQPNAVAAHATEVVSITRRCAISRGCPPCWAATIILAGR